jgi:hypothetical protein
LYRSGFACEESRYKATVDDVTYYGRNKTELKDSLWEAGIKIAGVEAVREVNPSPLAHCLHTVKLQLEKIAKDTQCSEMNLYLSGSNNFRKERATLLPYKGNRLLPADRQALIDEGKFLYYLVGNKFHAQGRPYHYDNIKNYLIDQWDAQIMDNYEADDKLAMEQTAHRGDDGKGHCIASIDKDLKQCWGTFYNFVTQEFDFVNEQDAEVNLWEQALTGDMCDCIYGINGLGKVGARNIVEGVPEDLLKNLVFEEYEIWFNNIKTGKKPNGRPYKKKTMDDYLIENYTPESYMDEVFDLVNLLRSEEDYEKMVDKISWIRNSAEDYSQP